MADILESPVVGLDIKCLEPGCNCFRENVPGSPLDGGEYTAREERCPRCPHPMSEHTVVGETKSDGEKGELIQFESSVTANLSEVVLIAHYEDEPIVCRIQKYALWALTKNRSPKLKDIFKSFREVIEGIVRRKIADGDFTPAHEVQITKADILASR